MTDVRFLIAEAKGTQARLADLAALVRERAADPSVDRAASEVIAADAALAEAHDALSLALHQLDRYAVRVGLAAESPRALLRQETAVGA